MLGEVAMSATVGKEPSLIIVGAGLAGLSAGCYARMNGYRTRIFEMHDKPGGLCTSWRRGDYLIDGCIHWLGGSSPASPLYRMWQELGVTQGRQMVYADQFMRIEGLDGRTLVAYTDFERLQQHLIELAPEDERLIRRLVRTARVCASLSIPDPPELSRAGDRLRQLVLMLRLAVRARGWLALSVADVAERCKSPLLREGLRIMAMFPPEVSILFSLASTFAPLGTRQAGYPLGGSLALARAIEARYRELGGELRYEARVDRILVEHGRAVGIRLATGEEHRADAIISAADGHSTLFGLLEGRYVSDTLKEDYQRLPLFPGMLHVAFGVRRSFDDVPHSIMGVSLPLPEPLTLAGQEHRRLLVSLHGHDSALAPPGRTVVRVYLYSDYARWASLHEDARRYAAEKERVADQVLAALDRRFPGLASQVEMRDVATPVTYERFTGNWKGAFEGWLPTPGVMRTSRLTRRTLPGLESFYMAGQWVMPGGGTSPAALSGRQIIQLLCKREGRRFQAWGPGEHPRPAQGLKALRPAPAHP